MSTRRRMPKVIKSPADQHEGKMAEQNREKSVVSATQSKPAPQAPVEPQKATPKPVKVAAPKVAAEPKIKTPPKQADTTNKPTAKSAASTQAGVQRSVRVPIDDAANAKIKALSDKMGKSIDYIETGLLKKALAAAKKRLKSGSLAAIASEMSLLHTAHGDAKYRTTEKKLVLTEEGEKTLREVIDDPLEVITINSLAGALIGAELKLIVKKL